jgi:hypothetical protein
MVPSSPIYAVGMGWRKNALIGTKSLPLPLRANEDETSNLRKFTLEGAGKTSTRPQDHNHLRARARDRHRHKVSASCGEGSIWLHYIRGNAP